MSLIDKPCKGCSHPTICRTHGCAAVEYRRNKAAELGYCDHCNDGDGNCVFPYYGVAPHVHAGGDELGIGSTQLLPRAMWGSNFREDPECPGQGVFMRCPQCGNGEQPEA
jgi:hypothetical protein